MNLDEVYNIISKTLGINGRMISGSKSGYRNRYPNHVAIFNANIIAKMPDGSIEKLWYGDLDITLDENAIKSAALDGECELYVLREMDARFEFEDDPQITKYVYMTDGVEVSTPEDTYTKYIRNSDDQLITG